MYVCILEITQLHPGHLPTRVARFFLVQFTQMGNKYKFQKQYKKAMTCTKRS
jgi:hypothetical protein